MALCGPDGPEGVRLLHMLLSQHAALLVSGLLSAFNSTQDRGVSLVGYSRPETPYHALSTC
jgi:hypothetical protein